MTINLIRKYRFFSYLDWTGRVAGSTAFADATLGSHAGRRVLTPFQVFGCRVLVPLDGGGCAVGGAGVAVRVALRTLAIARWPLLAAALLTQLEDQLSGVVRDHGIIVFQDDTLQL